MFSKESLQRFAFCHNFTSYHLQILHIIYILLVPCFFLNFIIGVLTTHVGTIYSNEKGNLSNAQTLCICDVRSTQTTVRPIITTVCSSIDIEYLLVLARSSTDALKKKIWCSLYLKTSPTRQESSSLIKKNCFKRSQTNLKLCVKLLTLLCIKKFMNHIYTYIYIYIYYIVNKHKLNIVNATIHMNKPRVSVSTLWYQFLRCPPIQ